MQLVYFTYFYSLILYHGCVQHSVKGRSLCGNSAVLLRVPFIIYHKITLNMPVKLFFGLWILRSSIAFQNRDIFHPDWHPVGILDSQSKSGLSRQNRDDWTLCKVDFRKLKFYIQAVFLFLTLKLIINTLTNETIVERGYKHKLFQYQHLVVYHWL